MTDDHTWVQWFLKTIIHVSGSTPVRLNARPRLLEETNMLLERERSYIIRRLSLIHMTIST